MPPPSPTTDLSAWWDHISMLHPPANEAVGQLLDELRDDFRWVGHRLIDAAPASPDLTVALRSLHRALMDGVAAVVLHQDEL